MGLTSLITGPGEWLSLERDSGINAMLNIKISASIHLFKQISSRLGFPWRPLPDSEVPAAVYDEAADAELAYMDILLDDQRYKDGS